MKKVLLIMLGFILTIGASAQCDSLVAQDTITTTQYNTSNIGWFAKVDSGLVQTSTQSYGTFTITFQALGYDAILENVNRVYRQGCIGGDVISSPWVIYDKDCNIVPNNYTGNGTINNPYTNQTISDYWSYTLNPCEMYTAVSSWETIDSLGEPCIPDSINYGRGLIYYPLDSIQDCTDYGVGIEEFSKVNIEVYPVPFNDFLTIKIDGQSEKTFIKIYDLTGKLVYETITNENPIITTPVINSGVYVLVIDQNGVIYSDLIIKE